MELWRSNKGSLILIQNEYQERKQKKEQIGKGTQQTKMNKYNSPGAKEKHDFHIERAH